MPTRLALEVFGRYHLLKNRTQNTGEIVACIFNSYVVETLVNMQEMFKELFDISKSIYFVPTIAYKLVK